MENYSFYIRHFADPKGAIEIATRMGWTPEQDGDSFIITYPEEDTALVEFIFEYYM